MSKRLFQTIAILVLSYPTAVWADITDATATIPAGGYFSFDSGTNLSSGGDIYFDGLSIMFVGAATVYNIGAIGAPGYTNLTELYLYLIPASNYNQTPLTGASLAVNNVFVVRTNGGNLAKVLITNVNPSRSFAIRYTTYSSTGSGGTGGTPTITLIQNNYSYTLPGLPNYGIAPGSIFIIQGSNFSNLPPSGLPSLSTGAAIPTTSGGTSVSVTVGSVTTTPGIYYTSSTQLALVLPSNTPIGTGTLTVTNNGQTSDPAQIQVVQSAFGIATYYGTGSGQAAAEDTTFNLFTPWNSAKPGQTIILWGSGIGPDTSNDDKTFPQKANNLTNIAIQVYIGGIPAAVSYRGRSQFPGLDQIIVTVPNGVSGCTVSVVVSSGMGLLNSNYTSIPVAANGGACSDATSPYTGSFLQTLTGKTSVNVGVLTLGQNTVSSPAGPTTTSFASGTFYKYTQAQFASALTGNVSPGSCIVNAPIPTSVSSIIPTPTGLDAGDSISVSGASGLLTLTPNPVAVGQYAPTTGTVPDSFLPGAGTMGAVYGFNNQAGGTNVGSFAAMLNYASPLVWTNANISTVSRANGVTVSWTGGVPGSHAVISGSSTVMLAFQVLPLTVSFTCVAPVDAGQFTVPSTVTQALPPNAVTALNPPTLSLGNSSNPTTFSASGLDLGYVSSMVQNTINVTYQ